MGWDILEKSKQIMRPYGRVEPWDKVDNYKGRVEPWDKVDNYKGWVGTFWGSPNKVMRAYALVEPLDKIWTFHLTLGQQCYGTI